MTKQSQGTFPVLTITREDLVHVGHELLVARLSDQDMRRIASKFSDALSELETYTILADVVEFWLEIESENDKGGQA